MGPAGSRRRFFATLGLILLVALGVRVAYVVGVARHDHRFYDAAYYELQARAIADGHGYNDPFPLLPNGSHRLEPAADHPPLTVFALVPVAAAGNALDLSDETSRLVMRFEVALAGLFAVFLIGLLGREVAGNRAGLIAAGIAAVYPYLWVNDGLIMSEAFAIAATCGALILAFRLARAPSTGRAIALGVVCGVAALTRAELILLLPLLGIPLLWSWRGRAWGGRLGRVVLVGLAGIVVIAPWVAYNLSRFEDPTFLSTNDGTAMLASNCEPAYYGPATGLTVLRECIPSTKDRPKGDQSVVSRIYRDRAIDFMKVRKKRAAVVVLARIGRDFSLYRPLDMISWNEAEGRERWITTAGLWFYYPLLALSLAGVVLLRRRHLRQWPLFVPPATVALGALLSYGQTRFRATAEPSLVVLAACAIALLLAKRWPERAPGTAEEPGRPPSGTPPAEAPPPEQAPAPAEGPPRREPEPEPDPEFWDRLSRG